MCVLRGLVTTGDCTAVIRKDIWGARGSSDSRIVDRSKGEIWVVSGVTCVGDILHQNSCHHL